jgi:cytochrome c-type biogenesis protein CcmF
MAFANDGSTATLRVIIEPLVPWIWLGGGIICLGALVSLWPTARTGRVYAREAEPERAAAPPTLGIPAAPAVRQEVAQ